MAAGKPVVATDVGGACEAITQETGFLVEPGDYEKMAEHVIFLLQHPDKSEAMGRQARIVASNQFSTTRQLERVEKLYESLLSS
jgi:glycosyltransferase involved in cell wall biosynthesis